MHSEIGVTPLAHPLAGPTVARPCPESATLCEALRIEVKRRARRSDGTFSLDGCRFEIPGRYRHLNDVHLHYARWDLSRAGLADPRTGTVLCPIKPLDKSANANAYANANANANADAQRRKLDPVGRDLSPLPPSGMAPLLLQLLAEHAATGMPPAYLPATDAAAPNPTDQAPA